MLVSAAETQENQLQQEIETIGTISEQCDQLVGCEEDKGRLLSKGGQQRQVISAWGVGGIGKTKLVRSTYKSQEVRGQFQIHAWVYASDNFDYTDFFRSLVMQLCAEPTRPSLGEF